MEKPAFVVFSIVLLLSIQLVLGHDNEMKDVEKIEVSPAKIADVKSAEGPADPEFPEGPVQQISYEVKA
ncbi:hypothetical protein V6N13_065106 [Hibiscus sabdariffa]|uniref:Uncharacterized protein n=1 Tax=Hibiscus sabdariffa TaxID=183260 RepID=A0ABR2A0I9_9ROSI